METDVKNKLYPLIKSSDNSRVYQKTKTTVSDLSDDKIILSIIYYVALNNSSDIKKSGSAYSISLDTINEYAKNLFGREINTDNPPDIVAGIYFQTTFADYDKKTQSYLINPELYDSSATVQKIVSQYAYSEDGVVNVRFETVGDQVYVYDKLILNAKIDWANTGYGTIRKFDGTGLVEFKDDNFAEIDSLLAKYSDYFTEYKHTFKINSDGTYTYISTEPII